MLPHRSPSPCCSRSRCSAATIAPTAARSAWRASACATRHWSHASNIARIRAATLCLLNAERAGTSLPRCAPATAAQRRPAYSREMVPPAASSITSLATAARWSRRVRAHRATCAARALAARREPRLTTAAAGDGPQRPCGKWMASAGNTASRSCERHYRDIGIGVDRAARRVPSGGPYGTLLRRVLRGCAVHGRDHRYPTLTLAGPPFVQPGVSSDPGRQLDVSIQSPCDLPALCSAHCLTVLAGTRTSPAIASGREPR